MRFRFVHAADIHLGYEQYNLAERADDFTRAYLDMVGYAIDNAVDFVLIAGDLFHRANPDAWTLKQAIHGLGLLQEAGIPVIAIEGNHDAQHVYRQLSWMEFLCDGGYLRLLNLQDREGRKALVPFEEKSGRGSWVEIAGARIYGLKYYGAATGKLLEDVEDQIIRGPKDYAILMLHAGMEGQVPHVHGGLMPAELQPLREQVDYVALGHIHKQLQGEMDGFVFNPGSLETMSMEEMSWPHGFFDVQVDTAQVPKHEVQPIKTSILRPFSRISVSLEEGQSLEAFVSGIESAIAEEGRVQEGAVVELRLSGVASFKKQEVPVERLKTMIEARFSPLLVRVRNDLVPPGLLPAIGPERMARAELEDQIIKRLIYQHADYRDQTEAWSRLVLEVKNMAAERSLPAAIADHVRSSMNSMGKAPSKVSAEARAVDEASELEPVQMQIELETG